MLAELGATVYKLGPGVPQHGSIRASLQLHQWPSP